MVGVAPISLSSGSLQPNSRRMCAVLCADERACARPVAQQRAKSASLRRKTAGVVRSRPHSTTAAHNNVGRARRRRGRRRRRRHAPAPRAAVFGVWTHGAAHLVHYYASAVRCTAAASAPLRRPLRRAIQERLKQPAFTARCARAAPFAWHAQCARPATARAPLVSATRLAWARCRPQQPAALPFWPPLWRRRASCQQCCGAAARYARLAATVAAADAPEASPPPPPRWPT